MLRSSQADDRDRPKAPAAAGKTAEQRAAEQKEAANNANQAKGGRVAGAARGAAGGAAIGAIAGDAGKGAGAGAVAGTMRWHAATPSQRCGPETSCRASCRQTTERRRRAESCSRSRLRYLSESIRGLHGRPGLFGEVIEFRQAHQIASARDTGVTIPTVEGIWLFCTARVISPGPVQTGTLVVFVVDRAPWWS